MMELADEGLILAEIFRQNAAAKRRENRAIEAMDHALEEKRAERKRDEEDNRFAAAMDAIASEQRLAEFHDRLNSYDTAIVDAQLDNERKLAEVRQQRENMESAAYRLPDGRRVFKTEDGQSVFDDHGIAVSQETVDPNAIADTKPRWEAVKAVRDSERALVREQEDLHRFQNRVDEARERVDKGGITAKQLDEIGADLESAMPDAVRRKFEDHAPACLSEPELSRPSQATPATMNIGVAGPT